MKADFNRCVGLLVLDVTMSNPNGDPDMDSDPRTLEADGRGLISPVSVKRKLRDIVEDKDAAAYQLANTTLELEGDANEFGILERRGRDLKEIAKMNDSEFSSKFWDARLFGNTMLEAMKDAKVKGVADHFINTGVVQVGVGVSVAPVQIERMTNTNKAGVQSGKDRGMAPLAFKVVQHGIYTVPVFINPNIAKKTGATKKDIELLQFLLPHAYSQTTSAIRPQVSVLHAWFAEHKSVLGSCPEHLFLDALTPKVKDGVVLPTGMADYDIPSAVPEQLRGRFASVEDLAVKEWS